MAFEKEITQFQRFGTYLYEFDDVGNLVLNSSSLDFSQVYVAFNLSNFNYDLNKVTSFYDPTFTEFVPPATSSAITASADQLQSQLNDANSQNAILQSQLNDAIAANEATPSVADQQAAKQVILELREALGQGRVESDFSSDFPYTPINKPSSIISGSTISNTGSAPTVIGATAPVGSVFNSGVNNVGGTISLPLGLPPTGIGGNRGTQTGNQGNQGGQGPGNPGTPPNTPPQLPPTGGTTGGGGCLLAGTRILMADGTIKNVEEIQVGDVLYAYDSPYVTVLELKPNSYYEHYVLNGRLHITWEHPVLVGDVFVETKYLKIGDEVTRYDGTKEPLTSIVKVNAVTPTYNFIVDGNHSYIADDIVVHNPTTTHKT